MAYDVKVKIDLTKPTGAAGFGMPLILIENAKKAIEYTECSYAEDVVKAGVTSGSAAHKAAQLMYMQHTNPGRISVCAVTGKAAEALADPMLAGKGWRHLIVVNEGETASTPEELIGAVEKMQGKMLFISLDADDSTSITTTDLRRTVLFYCTATEDYPVPAAALVGETAGREAGSFTYKNIVLAGIAPQELSDEQIEAIHKKGGMTFVAKAGDNVTSEGKVAGGEYIDSIDVEDWVIQQLTYRTQKLLNASDKVPYNDVGIAMLEAVAVDVFQTAYNSGMIATTEDGKPDYSVTYALRAETSEEDRAKRHYRGGRFRFGLAGAVHTVDISGEIIV